MKRVLVVDDAIFMRTAIKLILEKNGYDIIGEAENGKMAIEMFISLKPELVTMDITMPVMDGIQALKAILKINADARVLMVTAMGQENMVKDAIVSGAKGFVVKPFKEEVLLKALSKL